MKKLLFLMAATLVSVPVLAQNTLHLLIGTYTGTGSTGIYSFDFNQQTGKVKKTSETAVENPSFVALSPDNKFAYSVSENGDGKGGVTAFAYDGSAKLTKLNTQSSNGDAPCHVNISADGKFVVVSNYSGGNFSVYPVKTDGSLGEAVQTIQHFGSGPDKSRQEKPHVHQSVFSPDGKYLFVNDLGLDKTFIYPFNSASATPVDTVKAKTVAAKPGAGPRHITFHPNGKLVFLVTEMGSAVSSFKYADGNLTPVQTESILPKDFHGETGAADIHVSPDGRFVYASNRLQTNNITAFRIDPDTGKLSFVQQISTFGKNPRNFMITPNGKFVLAGNQDSAEIVVYKRDAASGLLFPMQKRISVQKPVCIIAAH
ncbi:MAG: lactonase family protein [Mucilaginibacter polytrichastri]|nr:lactonase family protein [Mucilaginibacter polytrichastri]